MSNDYSALVGKVWNYAHVLRDQGIGYGDYVEQITFLLFLKMDQERAELLGEPSTIPPAWRWDKLAPAGRRQPGNPVPPRTGSAGAREGADRHHLPRRAEQAHRPGQAQAGGVADRRRNLDRHRRGRQGRHL
jgi:hypothetical protein